MKAKRLFLTAAALGMLALGQHPTSAQTAAG